MNFDLFSPAIWKIPGLRVHFMKNLFILILSSLLFSGCASLKSDNPQDPLENFNRPIYKFNRGLDKAILRPIAKGYKTITPEPVQKGVSNVFENLDDIITSVNGLLQGKVKQSGSDLLRVVINSTIGLAGIFDVASAWGLDKHDEDFGQTLGYWGIKPGPYLMLPFLGPSDFRDIWGIAGDYPLNPIPYHEDVSERNSLRGLRLIDKRASLLEFDSQLDEAIDEYAFVRDAFLQNRQYKVYDGNPPEDDDWFNDDDLEDDCLEDEDCEASDEDIE